MQRGHIFKRHGAWFARFYVRNATGGQKQVCKRLAPVRYPYRSKRAVESLARKYLDVVNGQRGKGDASQSLETFVDPHYFPYIEQTLVPLSVRSYKRDWKNHVKGSSLAKKPLREIRASTVQGFFDDLGQKNLARSSHRRIKALLSSILTYARVRCDVPDVLPSLAGIKPGGHNRRRAAYAVTLDEVHRMPAVLPEPAKTLVALAAFSGLSRSELEGLQWADLAADGLHVRRNRSEGILREGTKTEARAGTVLVLPFLRKVLERHRKRNENAVWMFEGSKLRPRRQHRVARLARVPAGSRVEPAGARCRARDDSEDSAPFGRARDPSALREGSREKGRGRAAQTRSGFCKRLEVYGTAYATAVFGKCS